MRIPENIRVGLREKLWALADQLHWAKLSWYEKASYYEAWTLLRSFFFNGHVPVRWRRCFLNAESATQQRRS